MAPLRRTLSPPLTLPVLLLGWAGCGGDESGLARNPFEPTAPASLFRAYAALGNSITAGVQSGGINDSTQSEAYPVWLAATFGVPEFAFAAFDRPGCTPPLASLVPPSYAGGADPGSCAGVTVAGPVHNLAVPGYRASDLLRRPSPGPADARALQDFILPPGKPAVQAMMELNPSFVTLWIGSDDVLAAALVGQPALATPVTSFAPDFEALLDSIAAIGAEAAVANVPDVTAIPALIAAPRMSSIVATLQLLGIPNLTVSNCDDKTGWFVSSLFIRAALDGQATDINCDATRPTGVDSILAGPGAPVNEVAALQGTITLYNQAIADAVAARGFALVDTHDFFNRTSAVFGSSEFTIELSPAATAHFGVFFSLDGIHPSSFAHRVVANAFIDAINARYGSSGNLLARMPG